MTNIDKIKKDKFFNETIKSKTHLEFELSSLDGVVLNEVETRFNYTTKEKLSDKETESMLGLRDKMTAKNKKDAVKKAKEEA